MNTDIRPFNFSIGDGRLKDIWLILGKGPTSEKYSNDLAEKYNVFALNHAMRGTTALVGHAIDIEVFDQMEEDALADIEYLCIPWVPHVRQNRPFYKGKAFFGPGRLTLPDYVGHIPLLRRYLNSGRLLSYNLCSAPLGKRNPALPDVEGYSFSAAVVFRLLSKAGAVEVRTLGVDGGNSYGTSFGDLAGITKLQTNQTSFDAQFKEIATTMNEFNVRSGPLDIDIPARVFVGCMPEQDLAYRVLEYSIHRHSSISVKVERLHDAIKQCNIQVPEPVAPGNRGRTPFSFQRFAIPALRKYSGRAVYVDSDMLVLRDFRSLWTFDMQGRQMLSVAPSKSSKRRPQFSVMLINCEKLHWDASDIIKRLDVGEFSYDQLMYQMVSVQNWSASLPETWNSLEYYDPEHTCLVHFTDMDGQPWLNPLHSLAPLWTRYLIEAVQDGAIARSLVEEEVIKGHVRPSLLIQVDRNEEDPRRLPFSVLTRDLIDFFPPHRRGSSALSRVKHEWYRTRKLVTHLIKDELAQPTIRRARNIASTLISTITR